MIVDAADEPSTIVRLLGFAEIRKFGAVLVETKAVSTVSGTGVRVPLARVTQTLGLTLVLEQPAWNPRLVPIVF